MDQFGLRISWSELLGQLAVINTVEAKAQLAQRALLENQIKELSNRRSIRWANAVGSLARSRSVAEARKALGFARSDGENDLRQR